MGVYVYNGDPAERARQEYFTAGHRYTILIPISDVGGLSSFGNFLGDLKPVNDKINELAKGFFKQEYGFMVATFDKIMLHPSNVISAELTIVYTVTKTGLPIKQTVDGFVNYLKQQYSVKVSTKDSTGLPAPWVWNDIIAPQPAPISATMAVFVSGFAANLILKSYIGRV